MDKSALLMLGGLGRLVRDDRKATYQLLNTHPTLNIMQFLIVLLKVDDN